MSLPEPLLMPDEAAARMKVSRRFAYRLVAAGQLSSARALPLGPLHGRIFVKLAAGGVSPALLTVPKDLWWSWLYFTVGRGR
jgi:excisionase family DNA binding protein